MRVAVVVGNDVGRSRRAPGSANIMALALAAPWRDGRVILRELYGCASKRTPTRRDSVGFHL